MDVFQYILGAGSCFSRVKFHYNLRAIGQPFLFGRCLIVTPNGNSLTIDGGTAAGSNLFHSFREFSIPTGSEAFFNNATNIQNIFSRITGGKISNIDGLIRANGSANLFLINPSGIIFGPNARLNIGGSFLASTANNILFNDGNSFSATNPQAPPLLTVNVPIGLQLGQNSGAIQLQGTGHRYTAIDPIFGLTERGENMSGLQVKSGQTLALVGGNIELNGSVLTAEGGRIELGSVGTGEVSFTGTNSGWILGYEKVQNFRDINLSQQAALDASGLGNGSMQIVGRQVRLIEGSRALIQNQGDIPSGSIDVNASELLELRGTTPETIISSSLVTETPGKSKSGDINILTRRILIEDGGFIGTKAFGSGASGDLNINALDSIEVGGYSPFNSSSYSSLSTFTFSSGNAGNLIFSTRDLKMLGGATISSVTFLGGKGNAGDIILNVSNTLELSGINPVFFQVSSIGSGSLAVGNAGNVIINTSRVIVRNGAAIGAPTFAQGSGGNFTINASDFVEVSGTAAGGISISGIASEGVVFPEVYRQRYRLPDRPSGNSANLTITTPRLTVSDGARVTVANQGTGIAGNLKINAQELLLNNKGNITAFAASGEGGNIQLQISGDTILRNGSQITAEAGGTGNGGNLIVNSNTLAILEGSKVTANAFQGNGGNIRITTQGLFASPDSSITASSNFGVSGSISINNPNLDPSSGLVQLPQNVVDTTTQIAQGCTSDEGNTFTLAGRGGFPEEPTSTLAGQTIWQDLENYAVESKESNGKPSKLPVTTLPEMPSLVEAVGWQKDANGDVELVANLPNGAELTGSDRASNNNCPRQKVER